MRKKGDGTLGLTLALIALVIGLLVFVLAVPMEAPAAGRRSSVGFEAAEVGRGVRGYVRWFHAEEVVGPIRVACRGERCRVRYALRFDGRRWEAVMSIRRISVRRVERRWFGLLRGGEMRFRIPIARGYGFDGRSVVTAEAE